MKMKYKVGDKVRVREDLVVWTPRNMHAGYHNDEGFIPANNDVVSEMAEHGGKVATIVGYGGVLRNMYRIDLDACLYLWTDGMFTGLADEDAPAKEATPALPELKTGLFGVMDDGDVFVVVGERIVYQNGGFDFVKSFQNPEGAAKVCRINALYTGNAFSCTKFDYNCIWKRT